MWTADAGWRLRNMRLDRGWTMEHTADRCGVAVSTISKLETGYATAPRTATLKRVARVFKLSVQQLVFGM